MKPRLTTRILKYLLTASMVIAVAYALVWVVLQGYSFPWTGFGDFTKPNSDFVRGKTLWDWMQLFIIPIFLSVGVFLLNRSERDTEREIATDRQQEASLQSYLDRIANLLLKEELRTSKEDEVRDVAKVRTLSVLRGLDGRRKGMVLLFLQESRLIMKKEALVDLRGADLSHADLRGAALRGVDLRSVDLSNADLRGADLRDADLSNANLNGANLSFAASISGADLSFFSRLRFANRHFVDNLIDAQLPFAANLSGANLSLARLNVADLRGVDLSNANLSNAKMCGANLSVLYLYGVLFVHGANLHDADLSEADLSQANLRGADLKGARVREEQLATARSLKGATMPDGTIHE